MKFIESPQELTYQNGVPVVVWCYWEGDDMIGNRKLSFDYLTKNIGVPVALITPKNLEKFVLSEHPIPVQLKYLSIVHRSDYVRAYLMHHYGGAWHDIKATEVSYKVVWDEFKNENIWIIGRKEHPHGAAKIHDELGRYMPEFYNDLIAVPSWVARPHTPLSKEILADMDNLLHNNSLVLQKYPAKHPREKKLMANNPFKKLFYYIKFLYQGRSIHYPIEWTFFGNSFHPKILKYKDHISKNLPEDRIKNAGIYHRG